MSIENRHYVLAKLFPAGRLPRKGIVKCSYSHSHTGPAEIAGISLALNRKVWKYRHRRVLKSSNYGLVKVIVSPKPALYELCTGGVVMFEGTTSPTLKPPASEPCFPMYAAPVM